MSAAIKVTPTATVLYEIDIRDIQFLPAGTQVLKQAPHGGYFLYHTVYDVISYSPGARYFLFKAPALIANPAALPAIVTT